MATKEGKRLGKLRQKVTVQLMIVVLLVALVTAATALRAHQWFFSQFIVNYRQDRTQVLGNLLSAWYQQSGSWDELGRMGLRRAILRSPDRILIFNAQGDIVLDTREGLPLPAGTTWRQWATPIVVREREVGSLLLLGTVETGLLNLEAIFSNSVRNATFMGGLLGVFLAILLGLWWSTPISRRLTALETASRRLAQRDWTVCLDEGGGDELSEVSKAFNFMTQSLEKSERARRTLVADIAHELRTPLAILRGNLEALQEGVVQATPELMASLADETVALSQLVADLQELSLAEAQALRVDLQPVSPARLMEGAVSAIALHAAAEGLEVETRTPEQLPLVWADQRRTHQILLNLLSNAVRHTPPGGRVLVAAEGREDHLLFVVEDSGPGLDDDDMEMVFERFYGRARGSGGGLGLAIARGLVEAQGGRLWAEPPQWLTGARFCFTLKRQNSLPAG